MQYLSSDKYLGFLHIPKKQGDDFTHIANIETPLGIRQCYVKVYPDNEQSLLNEIIGQLYAKGTGIPTPKQTGLVEISVGQNHGDILHKHIPDRHAWIKNQPEVIGWWATDEQHPSIKTAFKIDDLEQLKENSSEFYEQKLNKLITDAITAAIQNKDFGAICAFDHIFANVDRNLGNILFGTTLISIDHGKILGSNHWKPKDLPNIATQEHINKMRTLVNNVLQQVPDNVKLRAIKQFDEIKRYCDENTTQQVLEFIQGFSALQPDIINQNLQQYLINRLSLETEYKNSFGMLI